MYYIWEHSSFNLSFIINYFVILFLCTLCLCLLYSVVCMHRFLSTHVFIVYNSVHRHVNVLALFYNSHIIFNLHSIMYVVYTLYMYIGF